MKIKSAAKYEFWQYIHAQSNSFTNLNMNVQSTANFTTQQQIHKSESPISNSLPTSHCHQRWNGQKAFEFVKSLTKLMTRQNILAKRICCYRTT